MDPVKESFEEVCRLAQKEGAGVELLIHESENLKISYQKKKLDKYEMTTSRQGGFRVLWGGGQGYASTENFSPQALLHSYQEALSNAKALVLGAGESSGADPSGVGPVSRGESPAASPESLLAQPAEYRNLDHLQSDEQPSLEAQRQVAEWLESKTLEVDPRLTHVPYTAYVESRWKRRLLNSNGVDAQSSLRSFFGYAHALAKQDDQTKSDGDSFFSRDFSKIQVEPVCQSAAQRALSRLGARPLPTGTYPVLIDREEVPSFISMLLSHLSAQEVLDEKSLLKGKVGQKVAASILNLLDDPFDERGSGLRSFDSEGTPSRPLTLIQEGVLQSYFTNLETAQRLGVANTGHALRSPSSQMSIGPSNIVVQSGEESFADLVGGKGKVVHLSTLNGGLHAGYKASTGDFSLPAEGFLYEGGKNLGPVDQFVVSGNILDLLMKIEKIGRDYNSPGNSILSPDWLISELSFAGG